jgi:hypothetical protein
MASLSFPVVIRDRLAVVADDELAQHSFADVAVQVAGAAVGEDGEKAVSSLRREQGLP